jgi:hypothetical protein
MTNAENSNEFAFESENSFLVDSLANPLGNTINLGINPNNNPQYNPFKLGDLSLSIVEQFFQQDQQNNQKSAGGNNNNFSLIAPAKISSIAAISAPQNDPLTGNNSTNQTTQNDPLINQGKTNNNPYFAIEAAGMVSIKGSSDFDGDPKNLLDDASIYGGKGFNIYGNSVLPVERNSSGNAILDATGKQILRDKAVAVTTGYLSANVSGQNRYSGLIPPQIVAPQTIDVPAYATLLQEEQNKRIPVGAATIVFDAASNPLKNLNDWNNKFPVGGTASQPKVVKVVNGGLTIPDKVRLSNYAITVENGDINFSGSNHNLDNAILIAKNGNINLVNATVKNTAIFAHGTINSNRRTRFSGASLLANDSSSGNINFNSATATISDGDELRVISQGGITYNGASNTRGQFVSIRESIDDRRRRPRRSHPINGGVA